MKHLNPRVVLKLASGVAVEGVANYVTRTHVEVRLPDGEYRWVPREQVVGAVTTPRVVTAPHS